MSSDREGLTVHPWRSAGGLAALTLGAAAVRYVHFARSPEPVGTDGYYYVVQVSDLVALGRLHVPDASWVLRFLAAVAAVVGDPIVGVKLGAALLAAACVPAAWWLGQRSAPGSGAAWALAMWAAASPTLTHLGGDFAKNLGVAAPLLVVLGWLARAGDGAGDRWWHHLLGAGALLAATTAHRLGAALALAVLLGAGLGWLSARRQQRRQLARLGLVAGGAAILAFALASLLLPALLHPADVERLFGQLRATPGLPGPFAYFLLRPTDVAQIVELGLAWPALIGAVLLFWRRPQARRRIGAAALPLAVCLFPLWRGDVLDVGYRLTLMTPLFALPLLGSTPRWRLPTRRAAIPLAVVGAALLLLLPSRGIDPSDAPPYAEYRALIRQIPRPLPELLIAHAGINFLYDHETGAEAMAWAPEPHLDRTRVGRLAHGIHAAEWADLRRAHPAIPSPLMLSPTYAYVREDTWEILLADARARDDQLLLTRARAWQNPTRVRPPSLLRNR